MPRAARFSPLTCDFHRHLEGSLFIGELIKITQDLQVPFDASTTAFLRNLAHPDDKTRSIETFINRLATRWIRLALLKIYISYQDNPEKGRMVAVKLLETITQRILTNAKKEGITRLNILVSAYAFAVDGDLSPVQFPHVSDRVLSQPHPPEARTVHTAWKKTLEKNVPSEQFLSAADILEVIKTTVKKREKQGRPATYITLALRRDADWHRIANTSPWRQTAADVSLLFSQKIVDLIDLCGPETEATLSVNTFRNFFRSLKRHHVPFTIHAGELPQQQAPLAYANLRDAVSLGACMIAHAVRLMDDHPTARRILKTVVQNHIILLLNITSNEYTGLTQDHKSHPFLHHLFRDDRHLKKILFVLTTDDPNVFSAAPIPILAHEYTKYKEAVAASSTTNKHRALSLPVKNEKRAEKHLAATLAKLRKRIP